MTENLFINTQTVNQSDYRSDHSYASALMKTKMEFQPEKKPVKGNNGDSDFKLETLNHCGSSHPRRANCTSSSSSVNGKNDDSSEFYEHGLDPELSLGITSRKIGAGLENLGNTCFLNSVLQCLTYTEPLAAYLQSGKHKSSCHVAGFCALCAIQNHVSRALQSTGRILVPKDLVSNLCCISRNFRIARQEDAHEYMVNLLESMHKCCLPLGVPSESPGAYEKSLVHKIFGGILRSQVKCQQCSNCSNKFDPFLDLSLEISKADSLHKALVNFTTAEWLDGGERQYQCQRCKQKVRALKQLTIHKAPYVLAIHLKRFDSYDPGRKINKNVQFGCALDLKPFVSGSYEGELKYSLYGVLVHSGHSTHSGHYYCHVRTSNNMWYTLDDKRVYHASEREVLSQQAYMLFYVRDQKSIVPRKTVDIAQKENVKMDTNRIRVSSTLNQGFKELVQNGLAEIRPSDASPLCSEAQKNILNVDSRVSSLNDVSAQQRNSLTVLPIVGDHQNSCAQHVDDETSHKINAATKLDVSAPGDPTKNISNISDSTASPIQSKNKSSQAGGSAVGSLHNKPSSSVSDKAVGNQGPIHDGAASKTSDIQGFNHKRIQKSKKKLLRHQVLGMRLSSNMFFMESLDLGKKKKHTRSKHSTLNVENPNKEQLGKHVYLSDVKPSTPGEVGVVLSESNFFLRRATNLISEEVASLNSNSESMLESISNDKEFKERIGQNLAVLATAKQVESIPGCTSVVNKCEARQSDCPKDSTLTQGVEETVVTRRDDSMESNSGNIVSIGNTGDECDEEYEKGKKKKKKKKLRKSKHRSGGQNPFQEIASKNSHSKRAKVDQSSSGNTPFRI